MNLSTSGAKLLLDWALQQAERRYPVEMARPIRTLGIVGAGLTGSRIALLAWQAGFQVVVTDRQTEALERLCQQIPQGRSTSLPIKLYGTFPGKASEGESAHWVQNSLPPEKQGDSAPDRAVPPWIMVSQELALLWQCDLVLECLPENLYLKQRILRQVQAFLDSEAVLATNTSTIPVSRLAEAMEQPGQLCGIHFFMPIPYRPVVEVVGSRASSALTLASAIGFVRRLGMVPLLVEDGPGFLANRLLMAWLNEALQLLEEGYRPAQIDQQAERFGWALGPFALMDWIGLDVILAGAGQLADLLADRLVRSSVLIQMVKKGQLGRKSGLGFYRYLCSEPAGKRGDFERLLPYPALSLPGEPRSQLGDLSAPDGAAIRPQQPNLVDPSDNPPNPNPSSAQPGQPTGVLQGDPPGRRAAGIVESSCKEGPGGNSSCLDRLHVAILVEVEQMIQEGRVVDPRQVDVALVGALGFPAHRGGLLAWADQIGLDHLVHRTIDCPEASFRHHSAYARLCERANTQKRYYPNCPDQESG